MNLGTAFSDRIAGERKTNLEEAIHCYRSALEVWTKSSAPHQWASTQNNLALAFMDLPEPLLPSAVQHFQQCLEVRTPDSNPHDYPRTATSLARCLIRLNQLTEAHQHLSSALQVLQQQRDIILVGTDDFHAKAKLSDQISNTISALVKCCITQDKPHQAVEFLDSAHAQGLLELSNPASIPDGATSEFVEKFELWTALRQQIRAHQRQLDLMQTGHKAQDPSWSVSQQQISSQIRQSMQQATELYDLDNRFQPASHVKKLSFNDVQQVLGNTTLAALWYESRDWSGIIVVCPGFEEPGLLEYSKDEMEAIMEAMNQFVEIRKNQGGDFNPIFALLGKTLRLADVYAVLRSDWSSNDNGNGNGSDNYNGISNYNNNNNNNYNNHNQRPPPSAPDYLPSYTQATSQI
eukprot:m.253823 g.253823  ORF g.253823 m.253823 type:complete len:406 (+) comp26722_c0_seq2:3-1220(+)